MTTTTISKILSWKWVFVSLWLCLHKRWWQYEWQWHDLVMNSWPILIDWLILLFIIIWQLTTEASFKLKKSALLKIIICKQFSFHDQSPIRANEVLWTVLSQLTTNIAVHLVEIFAVKWLEIVWLCLTSTWPGNNIKCEMKKKLTKKKTYKKNLPVAYHE